MNATEPSLTVLGAAPPTPSPEIQKQPRQAYVQLIVTSTTGQVMGLYGGENPPLAKLLSMASQLIDTKLPVTKTANENVITALGNDFYCVSRDFVLSIKGFLLPLNWTEMQTLERQLPSDAIYTFVVSI